MPKIIYYRFDLDLCFLDKSYASVLPRHIHFTDFDKNGCPRSLAIGIRNRGFKEVSQIHELYDEALRCLLEEGNRREQEYWNSLGEN